MGIKDKLKKTKQKKERIDLVCRETGWSQAKARKSMDDAAAAGVTNYYYMKRRAYELDPSEVPELGRAIAKINRNWKEDRKYYTDIVRLRSGWSQEEAEAHIELAKEKGIPLLFYLHRGGWLLDDAGLDKMAAEAENYKKNVKSGAADYNKRIAEVTGWPMGKVELEVCKARADFGASHEDYFRFRFYEKSDEERKLYPTLRVMERFRLRYCSYEPRATHFDDKAQFNRTFAEYVKRAWFTNEGLTYEQFLDNIRNLDYILVKPITDSCGNGISKHKCNVSDEENRRIYDLIMSIPDTLVEEYIVQHEDMMRLCPTSVNTIRVNTMQWQGECVFQFAVVRTGCGDIIDNFHNGGIAARVDLETGIINADATDLDGNLFETNPYSGVKFRGYQIPHWDMILDLSRKLSGKVKDMDYVGWDFAVTPDGVDLIEGNEGAYVMPQMCNLQDNTGLRPVLCDPYMKEELKV